MDDARVIWEIDVPAGLSGWPAEERVKQAAREALTIMQDPASTALVFRVILAGVEYHVDLAQDTAKMAVAPGS